MTKRTTREKLIAYLSEDAKRQNSNKLSIPCKMRDEGLIEFEKNRFALF